MRHWKNIQGKYLSITSITVVVKSLKISYKQGRSERLRLQFQSCFVFLDSWIKNTGDIIKTESLMRLAVQDQIYIYFFSQVEILVRVYKIHKIKRNPLIPWGCEQSSGNVWTLLLSQKRLRAGEKARRKGEVTLPPLFHPMATTHSGIFTGSSAFVTRWEGPSRDIFAIENIKECKSRKVEKRNNSRWEWQSIERKEGRTTGKERLF